MLQDSFGFEGGRMAFTTFPGMTIHEVPDTVLAASSLLTLRLSSWSSL